MRSLVISLLLFWKLLESSLPSVPKSHVYVSSVGVKRRRQWHPLQYSRLENPMDGGAW